VSAAGSLDRRRVVARLLQDRRDAVVVTGLGSPTYDVAAAGDVERNFYLWGAMPSWDGPWLKSRFQHAIAAYHEPCSPAPSSTRSDVRRFKG
jgi:hypothetical protein